MFATMCKTEHPLPHLEVHSISGACWEEATCVLGEAVAAFVLLERRALFGIAHHDLTAIRCAVGVGGLKPGLVPRPLLSCKVVVGGAR